MIHRLFQGLLRMATIASVLLFLAAVVLWVRSHWVLDDVGSFDAQVRPEGCFVYRHEFTLLRGMLCWFAETEVWPEESERGVELRGEAARVNRELTGRTWTRRRDLDQADDRVRSFRWTTSSSLQIQGMVS